MTESLPYLLFDTGPLLSFGACKNGSNLLRDRYEGRAGSVTDVIRELDGLTRNNNRALARAAGAASGFTWLDQIEVTDEAVLLRAEELRTQLRAFQKRPDQASSNKRRDWGECVTLAYAEQMQASGMVVVVANEDAARALAQVLPTRIPTATAVDVLRGLVRDKALTKKQAWRLYRQIYESGIDPGEGLRSAEDF